MPILSHRVSDGPGATATDVRHRLTWVIVGLVMLVLLLIGVVIYQWVEVWSAWRELAQLHHEIRAACTGPAAALDLDTFALLCRG